MCAYVAHIFYIYLFPPSYNREKEASAPPPQLNPNKNNSRRYSHRKKKKTHIKISLCLSQFDLMKFGDIDSLVSALSKLIQRSLGRDQKHLLPLILNHLKIMIK